MRIENTGGVNTDGSLSGHWTNLMNWRQDTRHGRVSAGSQTWSIDTMTLILIARIQVHQLS